MPHTSHPPRSPLINAHLRRYEIQSLCEVFIADPVTTWPKSGVKQTLVDNLDTSFTFTYKFVYGNNLNADGATEDDDVPIVRGDPVSKKKKSDSGIDLGLAIGVLIAAVIPRVLFRSRVLRLPPAQGRPRGRGQRPRGNQAVS